MWSIEDIRVNGPSEGRGGVVADEAAESGWKMDRDWSGDNKACSHTTGVAQIGIVSHQLYCGKAISQTMPTELCDANVVY